MKLKKAGKYSIRSKAQEEGDRKGSCDSCSSVHETGRCPARSKECFVFEEKDHFARSKACSRGPNKGKITKKVTEADEDDDFEESDQEVNRVTAWRGTASRLIGGRTMWWAR